MQSLEIIGQYLLLAISGAVLGLFLCGVRRFLASTRDRQVDLVMTILVAVCFCFSLWCIGSAYKAITSLVSPVKQLEEISPAWFYLVYCLPALVLCFLAYFAITGIANRYPQSWFAQREDLLAPLAFATVAVVTVMVFGPWPVVAFDSTMALLFGDSHLCQTECHVVSVEETDLAIFLYCQEGVVWLFSPAESRDNLLSQIRRWLATVKYSPLTGFAVEIRPE